MTLGDAAPLVLTVFAATGTETRGMLPLVVFDAARGTLSDASGWGAALLLVVLVLAVRLLFRGRSREVAS
jgi:ABC-type phosphate transport system permease subunit